ncbi:MAG: GTP cyclohydrolase I FolE [Holosporaceae bacterium]|jgi:GTP cyclohydrolase I|nr:GTP cyclohydrolase I FolE [Holosporaceae bacterium]
MNDIKNIEESVRQILNTLDPNFGEMEKTPARVAKVCGELFSGYGQDPAKVVNAFYNSEMNELVILKNIDFESCCEHHMVPIVGVASVGYVPRGKIVGASKIVRIVDCFAHKLQLQERLTMEIAQCLETLLDSLGVAVLIVAEHFCISHCGVKKPHARLVTRYFTGILKDNYQLRMEFLQEVMEKRT